MNDYHQCSIDDFAVFVLSLIKSQTDEFIKGNSSTCNTPRKLTGVYSDNFVANIVSSTTSTQVTPAISTSSNIAKNAGCNAQNDNKLLVNGVSGDIGDNDGSAKRTFSRELFSSTSHDNNIVRPLTTNTDSTGCERNENENQSVTNRKCNANNLSNKSNNSNSNNSSLLLNDYENETKSKSLLRNSLHDEMERSCNFNKTTTSTPVQGLHGKIDRRSIELTASSTPIETNHIHPRLSGKNVHSFDQNQYNTPGSRNTSKKSLDRTFNTVNFNNNSTNNSTINRRSANSSLCLSDFINTSLTVNNRSKKKHNNSSQQHNTSDTKCDNNSIFSNDDFPSLSQDNNKLDEPNKRSSSNNSQNVSSKANRQDRVGVVNSTENNARPKKRVVPITISNNTSKDIHKFTSSSFHADNNLIKFMEAEEEPLNERQLLRNCKETISKDFENELQPKKNLHAFVKESMRSVNASQPIGSTHDNAQQLSIMKPKCTITFDVAKVTNKLPIKRLSQIYSFIIDMNLVPNILTELSYLINLLNVEFDPYETIQLNAVQQTTTRNSELIGSVLKNLNNCIYFAIKTLNYQKYVLAMLDCTTLKVLIENERIKMFNGKLFDYLKRIHQCKSQLDASFVSSSQANKYQQGIGNNTTSVLFQQENDNRDNFPSDQQFGAFKKQRDIFYSIFRSWEFKHLDPTWNFKTDLGGKVKSLLFIMEHPINFAHLAKLFVAQLIISSNFDNSTNELQLALPNIDLSKLSKLRQRLVAPSLFSTNYLFPGNQAFFKDFILSCENNSVFLEQLKIAIITELIEINESSYETLSISNNDDNSKCLTEFIVRSETVTTLRVLAKFVGFIVSLPYNYDGYRNTLVDMRQIQIRNMTHPDFDIKPILLKAIKEKKLIITIPWLVQYLAMLDFITIRLNYYKEIFQILFTIYMQINVFNNQNYCALETSKFILRSCLGWLFEHPHVPEEYYNPQMLKESSSNVPALCHKISTHVSVQKEMTVNSFNQLLERVLDAACPFLADFRVSVMPSRISKTVSRTGRFRHITTKYSGDSTIVGKSKVVNVKNKLIDAFLQTQSLSVRKTVEFVIDRVFSAVVKDFQKQYLLQIRIDAKAHVDALNDVQLDSLIKKMYVVYNDALKLLHVRWDSSVEENARKRARKIFESLLPEETLEQVKNTLIEIAVEKIAVKLNDWKVANISTIDLFSKDIQGDASKLIKTKTVNNMKMNAKEVININVKKPPSSVIDELQTVLHLVSLKANQLNNHLLKDLLEGILVTIDKHLLRANFYKSLSYFVLQLALMLICNRCDLMTHDIRETFMEIWRHEKIVELTKDEQQYVPLVERNDLQDEMEKSKPKIISSNSIFSNVISCRFLHMIEDKPKENYDTYVEFVCALLNNKFIDIEDINEQCVQLYKEEWRKETLDNIAYMMETLKRQVGDSQSEWLDILSDLARDMEDF